MDALITQFRLQQVIKEPTHILVESSSCIDFIFMFHKKLVMESGVYLLLPSNCHHQITYAKFNLKTHSPLPYELEIWHYEQANLDHIRKAVDLFPW